MPVNGWLVRKYEPRNILPFPTGGYDTFTNEIKRYVENLTDSMSLGSDVKKIATLFADSIEWEAARPSTLASVCVLMAGSLMGKEFQPLLIDISKNQRKMKYTLLNWYPTIVELNGGMPDKKSELSA